MNELALFSGAGGGILGGKLLGWRTVCAVEIDQFRCERLAQRQNEGFLSAFPIWNGDIAAFDGKPWRGIVDVVSGGFPCQDISAANPKAVGIAGARSGLWKEMRRIVCEVGPRFVLVENSPMLTSRGLGTVLRELAALGYDARWGVLGADDLGGFHRRERLFLVADADQERLPRKPWKPSRRGSERGFQKQPGKTNSPLADGDEFNGWLEHQQQIGEAAGAREQSSGSCDALADSSEAERRPPQFDGANPSQRQHRERQSADFSGERGEDCLWRDIAFIECRDGKIRATKPGLCGMAHGVAHRVDRISAIGDGQVPVVVAAAWQILTTP